MEDKKINDYQDEIIRAAANRYLDSKFGVEAHSNSYLETFEAGVRWRETLRSDVFQSLHPNLKQNNLPTVRTKKIDEQMFDDIIARFNGRHFKYESLQAMKNWLIELRERLRWKPSENQLNMLEEVINNVKFNIRPFSSEIGHLESLYNDLKKLKED